MTEHACGTSDKKTKFIVVDGGMFRRFDTLYDVLMYVNENGGDIYQPLTTEAARQVCVIENQADEIEHLLAEGDEREEAARWSAHENETQAAAEIERLRGDMETAWVIIANAYGGDWDQASEASGWKKAAERWRDEAWHRIAVASCAEMYQPRPVDPR